MKNYITIDVNGFFEEEIYSENKPEIKDRLVETPCPHGLYQPRWNGESWEEGATQEYIDSLKEQAEPSLEERIQALEVIELERILGGGF